MDAPRAGKAGRWQVVNIATGDDEARYTAAGARKLPGGTVFREPQIDAWYVQKGNRVLPLDRDAVGAVGADGTTLAAYRTRVRAAYADKLPAPDTPARAGRAATDPPQRTRPPNTPVPPRDGRGRPSRGPPSLRTRPRTPR